MAAVRLRYSTVTKPALATQRTASGANVPAVVQTTRYAARNVPCRNSQLVCRTRHRPDGQSTVTTLCRKNSGSETTAATTKTTTVTDKLCRTFARTHQSIDQSINVKFVGRRYTTRPCRSASSSQW